MVSKRPQLRKQSRKSWILGASAAFTLACAIPACDCSGEVTVKDTVKLSFSTPAEGQFVTRLDDSDAATAGVQKDVVVNARGARNGTTVLLSNGIDVDSTGQPATISAQVTDGQATFTGYTFPRGAVTLHATTQTCNGSGCAIDVNVTVVDSICVFNTPHDGDTIRQDGYPDPADQFDPVETDVVADCYGVSEGDNVALAVNNGRPIVAQATAAGQATFLRVELSEGPDTLALRPRTDARGIDPTGTVATATVTVDTGRCIANLSPPDGTSVLAKDDLDHDSSNGMQAQLDLVTNCGADATVQLFLRGPGETNYTQLTITPSARDDLGNGTVRIRFTGVQLPESQNPYDVTAVATVDAVDGRHGVSVPTDYWVDSSVPRLLSYSPAQGTCVVDADATRGGVQLNATGRVTGAENGAEVWVSAYATTGSPAACVINDDCAGYDSACTSGVGCVRCREQECRVVSKLGDPSVGDNVFAANGVTADAGGITVKYVGLDLAGNESTQTVTISALSAAPTVSIPTTIDGAQLTAAQDADVSTPGLQYALVLNTNDIPSGTTGVVIVSNQNPQSFVPVAGSGTTTVTITLDNGTHTISVALADTCGVNPESNTVNVSVDADVPLITATAYEAGQFNARKSIDDGGYTLVSAIDLDVFVGAGNDGRTLSVTTSTASTVDTNGKRVCSGAAGTPSIVTLAAADTGSFFSNLALAEGVNCIAIELTSSNSVKATYVVNRHSSAPAVAIVDPDGAANWTTADDSNTAADGFTHDVSVTLATPDFAPGTLSLELRDSLTHVAFAQTQQRVSTGVTAIAFVDASFAYGSYDLVAVYTDQLGNKSESPAVSITIAAPHAGPQVAITAPRDGDILTNADLAVSVTLLGGSVPVSCDVALDGVVVATAVWAGDPQIVTVPSASLTDGAHTLVADCIDASNNTLPSNIVRITIDTSVPADPVLASEDAGVVGRLDFDVTPSFVILATADTSSQAGLQHPVSVLVHPGTESVRNWIVRLSVTPPGQPVTVYEQTLINGGEPTRVTFSAVDFGAVDGSIGFSVTVTDNLGRTSGADTATLIIDRTPPTVALVTPQPTQTLLTRDDDRDLTTIDLVDIDFTVNTSGGTTVALSIEPAPSGFTTQTLPAAASVTFARVAFESGNYAATFAVTDDSGNVTTFVYAFTVRALQATVTIAAPVATRLNQSFDTDAATPGAQVLITITATGINPGSPVDLCSTVSVGGASTPCKFGRNGAADATDRGVIIASDTLNGILQSSSKQINALLAEGSQVLHAEAHELDGDPYVASDFSTRFVDSVPPVIAGASFTQNSSGNDAGSVIRLNRTEGTPNGNAGLTVILAVQVNGLDTICPASATDTTTPCVLNVRSGGNIVASANATASGLIPVTLALPNGSYTLTFDARDASGNVNVPGTDLIASVTVEVDAQVDSASLDAPRLNPYTSAAGTVSGQELVLDPSYGITVAVSDTSGGGKMTLERYTAPSGGTAVASAQVVLNSGQTSNTFTGFHLVQGFNYLQATYVDRAGNTTSTGRIVYSADFIGPTLSLTVTTGSGAGLSCNDTTPCLADTLPRGQADERVLLDRTGSTAGCGGTNCATTGTNLVYSLASCVNSAPSLETCSGTIQLESRVIVNGSPSTPFSPVFNGVFNKTETSGASIPTDPQFEPGVYRELRITTKDSNGNTSVSPSVFLELDFSGVAVSVQRMDVTPAPTGDVLASDRYFGIKEDTVTGDAGFTTNFRADLTPFGDATPTSVTLIVNSTSGTQTYTGIAQSATAYDFIGVSLARATDPAAPLANAIDVEVMCGATACGPRSYTGIIADIDAPTYQFDRCTLQALGVPLSGGDYAACASADADANFNIATYTGSSGTYAAWNLARDVDHAGPTFNAPTIGVKLKAVENGQTVTLASDVGTVTGNTVSSNGCPTASTCRADFPAFVASNLSGTAARKVSVSFTDRAGNPGVPDTVRGDATRESIYARTDVLAPAGVTPTVCIGESTVPTAGTDPASLEPASCSAVCATAGNCDRLKATASITWTVPGDDDTSGTTAPSGYVLGAAALGIPYPISGGGTTTYTTCSAITADGPFEVTPVPPPTLQATGAVEQLKVDGLFPHRDYCFAVMAIDDVGNRSPAGSFVARRKLPLITQPNIQSFDGVNRNDAQSAGAFFISPDTTTTTFGNTITALPDINGDGAEDLAVGQVFNPGKIFIFYSGTGFQSPAITITAPTIGESGTFGQSIAGGDFDGDGYNDFAFCDPNLTTDSTTAPTIGTGGAGGGALFLYYGSATGVNFANNTNDPQLPSKLPSVALLGAASQGLCSIVRFANVNGGNGQDLVVATKQTGSTNPAPYVFGVNGGSRGRFAASKVFLNLTADAASGGPDFLIPKNASNAGQWPWLLETGDFDADGFADIAISDYTDATRGVNTGAVFVHRGGTFLSGTQPSAQAATSNVTRVSYDTTGTIRFGYAMSVIKQPRATNGTAAADTADWLMVGRLPSGTTELGTVVVLKGGTAATSFLAGTYPVNDTTALLLDNTNWQGVAQNRFGRSMRTIGQLDGQPGIEIAVGPGFPSSGGPYYTAIFSFDEVQDKFVKRVILQGQATPTVSFGDNLVGVRDFAPGSPAGRSQLIVNDRTERQIFLFK